MISADEFKIIMREIKKEVELEGTNCVGLSDCVILLIIIHLMYNTMN